MFCNPARIFVLALLVLLSGAVSPSLFAQISIGSGGFNLTNVCSYGPSIPSGCLVVGNGDAMLNGTALQLTTSVGNQFGSAWAVTPQTVGNGFTTTFAFQFPLANQSVPPADGIAFVIQNAPTGLAAIGYTGGNGGAIGYGDDDANSSPYSGIPNSLAIEFDSYQNGWDPDADHVAVQSCGIAYNTSHHNQSCTITGGSSANSTLGITAAGVLAAIPITISDGNPHTVTILYNPPGTYCNASNPSDTNNLCIYIDQENVTTPVPVLTVPVNLSSLITLGTGGTAYVGFTGATGGDWETQNILSWSFSGQPISTSNPASLTQTVVITGTPANPTTEFVADYSKASTAGTLILMPNTVPQFTPGAVTPAEYVTMVSNTALAETTCFISPYVFDSMGNPACPSVKLQCTNANSSLLQGDNCPQSSVRNLIFQQILEGVTSGGNIMSGNTVPTIPYGSAPTVAMGPDSWTTSACVLAGPEAGQLCPKSIGVGFSDITGKGGTTGSNSTFIVGCCEREYSTAVSINGLLANPSTPVWTNRSTNVPIEFTSTPPTPIITGSTLINGNTPSPGQSVTYGTEAPGTALDPTLPIATDTTLLNPNPPSGQTSTPCGNSTYPLTWATAPGTPASPFSTTGTIAGPFTDSVIEVHYFSTDCDEMEELVYTPNGSNNWAKFKTVLFGVDLTDPKISLNTALSPAPTNNNGVLNSYLLNQNVVVPYVCTDPATNGVESGVATCGSHNNLGGLPTANYTDHVPTNTLGSNTITLPVTDAAGNSGNPVSMTYTVVDQPVDLVLFNFPPAPSKISAGSKLTYVLFGLNLAKTNDAYNVTVTDTIPPGTTLVQAFFAGVPCSSSSSCSSPPSKGTTCPLSGTAITCDIGSLAPLDTKSGVAIVIVVNVPAGTKSGTVLLNSATATSWNRITDSYNSISMTTTVK